MVAVRVLSKGGQALAKDAPTATKKNPAWFIDGEATPSRRRLHARLLEETRAAAPNVEQQRRAVVLAGPPGAGKSTVLGEVLGADREKYLEIDADEFKRLLLREAQADGSYDEWLLPAAVRSLEEQGETFYPLELAALVHEESSELAKKLRADAIEAGDNIVIDTVLSDKDDALALGQRLHEAGYNVDVIDVEVPYELSEERIHSRWEQAYTAALDGNDLGGRWVPSEYARGVFDGPEGKSKPEVAARALAEQCPAVSRYRVYRTTMEMVAEAEAEDRPVRAAVEVDLTRGSTGAALVDTRYARSAAPLPRRQSTRPAAGKGHEGPGLG